MPPKQPNATLEIVQRLRGDLDALIQATSTPLSTSARRQLDEQIRQIMGRMDTLLRDLDPVRQPRALFDPGDPAIVGRFVALGMIAQPRVPLPEIGKDRFYGSGIYALYYRGEFPAYVPVQSTETPIYVGKVDPNIDTARTPLEQGEKLSVRLKDHLRSISCAKDTLAAGDFEYRALVVQSGWQGAAESYLIGLFRPIWNNEIDICYGLGKHGDAPGTRKNLRSPWDTLHPGRDWAHRDPDMPDARPKERILEDIRKHFETAMVFEKIDHVLKTFIEGLRQVEETSPINEE